MPIFKGKNMLGSCHPDKKINLPEKKFLFSFSSELIFVGGTCNILGNIIPESRYVYDRCII